LVDDSESIRRLLSLSLRSKGYQVAEAADGAAALEHLEAKPVDLVLLDILMPGMDGLQVLQAIRGIFNPEQLPVIMATAENGSEDMVRAFSLGANDYVTKPIDLPVALARIQAQLRTQSQAQPSPSRAGDPIQLGSVLDEKYLLESLIGGGQHGVVYKARHLLLDRFVALKVLHTSVQERDDLVQRFQREGISTCRIQHQNAVNVLDFSVTSSGIPILVMELLQGRTLAQEMRSETQFSVKRSAEICLPICSVLTEAHGLGIIHRDIKPQNIFLHRGRTGETVKVLDFGIAKLIDDSNMSQTLTHENILGTPAYMAPERFSADSYDGRADVYSLGVVLFEMLSGKHPFSPLGKDPLKLVMRHLKEAPPFLQEFRPDLPDNLVRLIDRSLRKDYQRRPSALQLAEQLASISGLPRPRL
jgi:serine/threonine protein kinase/CheY-like chemotaxis protein